MGREQTKRTCPCKKLPMCLSSFTAAEYGDLATLSRLGPSVVDRVDAGGYTPLHLAAQNGHSAATALLLQLGARVNFKDGAAPLHRASYSGAITTMRILLEHKWQCDLLARDKSFGDEMTPLHKASAGGRYLAVKLLLDALRSQSQWKDPSMLQKGLQALDSMNRTPLDVALELFENQEEARQSVRRWDVVAGGSADWEQCIKLLRTAEKEVQEQIGTEKKLQKDAFCQNSILEALPAHLSEGASCLDCGATSDGNCLTASWEAAFRSALTLSTSASNSPSPPTLPMQPTASNVNSVEASQQSVAMDQDEDDTVEVGRTCSECGVKSFALYRGKNGGLVCRSCSRPSKKRLQSR